MIQIAVGQTKKELIWSCTLNFFVASSTLSAGNTACQMCAMISDLLHVAAVGQQLIL